MQCTGIHCWIVWQLFIIRNTQYIQVSMFSVFDFGTAALHHVCLPCCGRSYSLLKCTTDVFLIYLLTFSFSSLHFHTNEQNFLLKNVSTNFLYISSSIQKQSKNMSKTMRYLNDNWHGIIYYLKKKNCIDFYVQYLQSKKKDDKRF